MLHEYLAQSQIGGSTFGLGALPLYLLFLALPGLVFVKVFIFADRRPDTLDRYDKLGYLLFGGVFSAIVLLLILRYLTDFGPIFGVGIGQYTILASLIAVLVQSLIAGILGLVLGMLRYTRGDLFIDWCRQNIRRVTGDVGRQFNDRQEPWEYVIDNIREQEVKVGMKNGNEIVGYVARFSSTPTLRTLALSPIEPDERTEIGPEEKKSNAIYIHDSDISHITFRDTERQDEYSNLLPKGDLEPPEDDATRDGDN